MKVETKDIFYFKNIFHWTSLFWNIFWPHVFCVCVFHAQSNMNQCISTHWIYCFSLKQSQKKYKSCHWSLSKCANITIQVLISINMHRLDVNKAHMCILERYCIPPQWHHLCLFSDSASSININLCIWDMYTEMFNNHGNNI